VYRSLGHIYAQVIDDARERRWFPSSSTANRKNLKGGGNARLRKVIGKTIAQRAKARWSQQVMVRPRRIQVSRPRQGAADAAREAGYSSKPMSKQILRDV